MDSAARTFDARLADLVPRAVALVAGVALWAQCAIGHAVELAWSAGGVAWRGAALLACGVTMLAAVIRRAPALVYGAFPISLLGPILLLGDEARDSLFSFWRWGVFCAAFAVWIGADALTLPRSRGDDVREVPRGPAPGARFDQLRYVLGLSLLVVPLGVWLAVGRDGIFVDDGPADVVFVHLLVVFAWLVAWYTFFVTPALNDAWDRSVLQRGVGPAGSGDRRRARRWLAVALVGLALTVAALVVLVATSGRL